MKYLSLLLFSSLSYGHGTDKPGPHGGMIQMPGAYHVEVVRASKQSFKIYLLDGDFKNPTLTDSSVKARVLYGKNLSLDCKPMEKDLYFECRTESRLRRNEFLIVESVRAGVKGNEAKFEFK